MNLKQTLLTALALTLPLAGASAITFTSNTAIGVGNTTYDGQEIIVSGCTLTVDGPHSFASLLLTNGAALTHSPAPNGEANNRLQLTVAGDCVIASDGSINVVGCGYAQALGPGAGPASSSRSVGAGYGGMGGAGTGWLRTGGAIYGTLFAPMDFGSGGGRLVNHSEGAGSSGGGAVFLSVTGTLTVEGSINASGSDINHWTQNLGGAGSGGSIYLVASALTGSGNILADGGSIRQISDAHGGGGGGGRVAVRFDSNTFNGTLSAKGGRGSVRTGEGAQSGGAGTICLQPNSTPTATVWINNGGNSGSSSALSRLNPSQWPAGAAFDLMVCSNAVLYPDQPLTLAGLNVTSGARLGHAPMDRNLVLTVLGNALLDASSSITADGCGYPEVSGPGAGTSSGSYYGSGAGHGGVGGWSSQGSSGPGGIYDSLYSPIDFGSGGGRSWNGPGGPGGGAVRLTVGGEFRLDGIISVKGQRTPSDNGGGGGSGGSVYLTTGTLVGDGFISVRGGDGGADVGGGGAGGRVAIYHQGIAGGITNQIDRSGGTSTYGQSGGWGTLYITNQYLPLEILTQAPTGTVRQAMNSVDMAFNQPVRGETFTPADVAITTPSGPIPSGDLTLTPLSAASYRVAFPVQSAIGAYQVQVGPHIANLYGQEMAVAYSGNFTITNPVISGTVRWTNDAPLTGVLLSATGGLSVKTDTNGTFTLSVPPSWSGTVTPTLAGWVFTPPILGFVNLADDATNQNFAAQPTGCVPAGLLSWWRGEDDTSDTLGLHPGTPLSGLAYTNGPVGRAFAFNGQDAAVALGNWFTLQTFTLSLWVQPAPGQVTYADIVDNNHTDYRSWCLQHDNVSDAVRGQWHWGTSLPSGGGAIGFSLRHNAWQHWTLTLDTNRVQRLYLDGQIVGSTTNTAPIPYDGTQFFNLGKHQVYGRHFKGALDEVMLFNRALDADEVTSLYVSQGGPPTLDIERQGGDVQLSWPAADLLLQSSPSLTPPSWQTVTNGIQSDGLRSVLTVPATNQHQFFRLQSGN